MKLKIGSRGSKLAIAYAERVCNELPCDTEIVTIKTDGDLNPDVPIHEIGGKGVFCSTIETSLLNGEIDVAVHSLKDMPGEEHPDLIIAAMLKRNSPHDVILGNIKYGCTIGTSGPRRIAQLKELYSNLKIKTKPIRGNIDTRLAKLDAGEYDAIILAEAGLQALDIRRTWIKIPSIPAVGQGVIALQTRKDDTDIINVVQKVNHARTFAQAQVERAFLKGIGGDCHTKLAAHAIGENPITLKAVYYD